MQVSTFKAFDLKRNNLLNRLQARVNVPIELLPLTKAIELPKLAKLPTPKTTQQRKEFIFYEYKLIEKRLGKKLVAKGVQLPTVIYDCTPPTQQAPIVKIKEGFMDNIGEIIDSNYNTIPLPNNNMFNL